MKDVECLLPPPDRYVFSLLAEAAESQQGGLHVCSSLRVPQRALQLRGALGFDSHCGSSQLVGQVWLHLSFGWGTKMHRGEVAALSHPADQCGEPGRDPTLPSLNPETSGTFALSVRKSLPSSPDIVQAIWGRLSKSKASPAPDCNETSWRGVGTHVVWSPLGVLNHILADRSQHLIETATEH